MSKQRSPLGRWAQCAALGLVAVATALSQVLLAPTAGASPEADAHDAITAAWEAGGGNESRLGAPQGDTYPVGAGFAGDFTGGKIFFTPAAGAHAMYGPILDKYESLGGPGSSDLGFPDIDQTAGLAGPESQYISFAASDHPLIFFTPEHGAFVVRGPINAAWDTLSSSSGPLGPPVADEAFDGDVVAQKFANGELSWNRTTKVFTTVPPDLAGQLAALTVAVDPTAAINAAWRATGAATGPLGVKEGEQQPVGDDGVVQNFAGGKIYFTPATGANAVEGDILAKYESLGGPAGSDLGFPISNPRDGGLGPDSQVSAFAAADQPVILWTSEHGAFVVRGAMKAAWDKLGGTTGDLGAPVGDQTIDGNLVKQEFVGGRISWNKDENSFTTEPAKLASSLSGLQIPGLGVASAPAPTGSDHAISWHWWWLPVSVGVLLLAGLLAWAARWRRQRGGADMQPVAREKTTTGSVVRDEPRRWAPEGPGVHEGPLGYEREGYGDYANEDYKGRGGHEGRGDYQGPEDYEEDSPPYGESFFDLREPAATEPDEPELPSRVAWAHRVGTDRGDEPATTSHEVGDHFGLDVHHTVGEGFDDDNADDVDTAPTRIPTDAELATGRHYAAEAPVAEEPHPAGRGAVRGESYGQHGTDSAQDHRAPYPAFHLPLSDPYLAPEGYPIKANTVSGLYYTPDNALYHDTLAEVWFATEPIAQANGFLKAE